MQSLSRELLGIEMDKAFHVQCGNWEAENLTERQVGVIDRGCPFPPPTVFLVELN